mmetsp:Transcript_23113/g.72128  ORF Transcript_23113/g.72128 Transcript_23113/m.72128 type:complete len:201 (+) Transcript_23113:511-1113(+)
MSSSTRMSKVEYSTPVSLRADTTLLLNPQRGASLLPFMKRSTSDPSRSFLMRPLSSPLAASACASTAASEIAKCSLAVAARTAGSAPSTLATFFPPLMKTKKGTAATSYARETSSISSASTCGRGPSGAVASCTGARGSAGARVAWCWALAPAQRLPAWRRRRAWRTPRPYACMARTSRPRNGRRPRERTPRSCRTPPWT